MTKYNEKKENEKHHGYISFYLTVVCTLLYILLFNLLKNIIENLTSYFNTCLFYDHIFIANTCKKCHYCISLFN